VNGSQRLVKAKCKSEDFFTFIPCSLIGTSKCKIIVGLPVGLPATFLIGNAKVSNRRGKGGDKTITVKEITLSPLNPHKLKLLHSSDRLCNL